MVSRHCSQFSVCISWGLHLFDGVMLFSDKYSNLKKRELTNLKLIPPSLIASSIEVE